MARRAPRSLLFALVALIATAAATALAPSPVFADAAGPTDYLSEVVAVEPPSPAISVEVIGGDSFVQLVADPGTEVRVSGYQGEEYLWFRPDGVVLENRNAPTTYLNAERYGNSFPDFADADAEADWATVGTSGRWAWHDHRAHWMQRSRPLAAAPGDQILEAVIPLVVDGVPVEVTVISTWQPAASSVPRWAGAAVGAVLVLVAARKRHRAPLLAVVGTATAGLAAVVGAAQFLSLPSETGPESVWWVLPVVALVCGGVALVAARRRAAFVAVAATLVCGVPLVMWAWIRRDGLTAALIPTDLPGWFDRWATALTLVVGVGLVAVAAIDVFRMTTTPVSASRAPSG